MPIEIRELIIRTEIVEGGESPQSEARLEEMKAEILAACRDEMRRMLHRQNER